MSRRHVMVALLAIALLAPAGARAVSIEKGVKAGLNLANFTGDFADLMGAKAKMGFVGGPFVAVGLVHGLAVQGEALFSMKGAKTSTTVVDMEGNDLGQHDIFWNLTYLEIPLLLRWELLRVVPVRPMLYAGPTFGVRLGGRFVTDIPGYDDENIEDMKPVDLGVAVGGGVAVKALGKQLVLDLRYTRGFGDLYDIDYEPGIIHGTVNEVFSVMAGVAF